MAIQRADKLFPVNSTIVDSGAGIDIRLLSDSGGATDSSQSVRWTHTQDGTARCFDPANGLVTVIADPTFFQGEGWALRLVEDHTPADDPINCNSVLRAGVHTVQMRCLLNMNGGTNTGGTTTINMRVAFFRYNTTSNTAVFLANSPTPTDQTWNTASLGGENNTRKNTILTVTISQDEVFGANEVLLVQFGAVGTTLPNATLGTTNFDLTLDVDDLGTFIDFDGIDGGVGLKCNLDSNLVGKGVVPFTIRSLTTVKNLVGTGTVAFTKATTISKIFNLIGKGVVTHTKIVGKPFNLIGKGIPTFSRIVNAAKSFTFDGRGIVTRVLSNSLSRTATGKGTVTFTKASTISKVFSLIGQGVVTFAKSTQAVRTFNIVGNGTVTKSLSNAIQRTVIGKGEITFVKASIISKIFDLIGKGTITKSIAAELARMVIGKGSITDLHPVNAFRTFFLIGKGQIPTSGPNASTVTIPIDEVPECEEGSGGTTIVKKTVINIFDD